LLPLSALAACRDNRGDSEGDRAFDVLTRELVFEAKAKPGERTLAGGWRARWELCAGQVEGSCYIRHVLSVRMHPDSSQVIIPCGPPINMQPTSLLSWSGSGWRRWRHSAAVACR
jgi:hypothetical protein